MTEQKDNPEKETTEPAEDTGGDDEPEQPETEPEVTTEPSEPSETSEPELTEEEKEKAQKKAGYLSRNPEEAAKTFEKLDKLEGTVKSLVLDNARKEAISRYPHLSSDDEDLLTGDSPEEIKQHAKKLNKRLSAKAEDVEEKTKEELPERPESPDDSGGFDPTELDSKTAEEQMEKLAEEGLV